MTSASEKGFRLFLTSLKVTDPTLTDEHIEAAITAAKCAQANPEPLPDPILSVAETSRLCGGVDRHTLLTWERRGWITAVRTGAAGKNVTGYTGESVRRFLAGKASEKEVA